MSSFISGGGPKGPISHGSYLKTRNVGVPVDGIAKLRNSIQIARTRVDIFHGNIADANTGIIVNPTNQDCNLIPHGVSGNLIATEGPLLRIFAFQGGAIKYGEVKVRKANNLHAEYVMHLAIDPQPDEQAEISTALPEQTKIDLIRICTQSALTEAEKMLDKLAKKSISFPALGTDMLGVLPNASARTMLGEIAGHAKTSSLENIQIILNSAVQFGRFNVEFNRLQAKISNAKLLPTK